jgi:hypothetical protein
MEFGGARQGVLNARTNIVGADVVVEFGLLHELRWLLASAAQE